MGTLLRAPGALAAAAALALAAAPTARAQSDAKGQDQQAAKPGILAERSMGSPAAPVTVYEMSDFQCPYCRRHAVDVFPSLERDYINPGKVHWIFINFPLTSIHPNAAAAAELALCGARVGKFWPLHDLLYKYQDTWAPLKDPGQFLLSLADSVHAPPQDDGGLPDVRGGPARARGGRRGGSSLGGAEHADVLYRGRAPGGRGAAAGVAAGAGFDLRGEK
jgi:hypothetical protein